MRKLQIGIIGSKNLDLNNEQDKAAWDFAYKVGFGLGRALNVTVLTNAVTGVAEAAAKGVKDSGGTAINIIPGKYKEEGNIQTNTIIATTMEGFEHCWPLVYSCDSLITIGGGTETGIQISLAVDLGLHVVIYTKAGGVSSQVFTSLEPHFQKMRSSQLVYLVEEPEEMIDRAKDFAVKRMKAGKRIDAETEVEIPAILELLTDRKRLAIILLLLKEKNLTPLDISDKLKIPQMLIESYLEELDVQEIVIAKKMYGDEILFTINTDRPIVRKTLNFLQELIEPETGEKG